jgi:DNA-binding FadR family transcriptional regulator
MMIDEAIGVRLALSRLLGRAQFVPVRAGGKLGSAVTADLGRRIIAGEFLPGEALPTELVLCQMFGVSRTTLREAVKRLHGKGLVVASPRNGTRVQPTQHWNQFDAEVLGWRVAAGVDGDVLDQLYEIRDCFEPRACHLAAVQGDATAKAGIRRWYDAMASARVGAERRIAADLEFHLAIFAATGNLFFVSLGAAIRTALHLSFSLSQHRTPFPRRELQLHLDVCSAIERGDGGAAEQSMRRLLDASRRTLGMALRQASEIAS